MTEPGPAGELSTTPVMETPHRLHRMSWLFVLLSQLRQFIVPLLALFIVGRRGKEPDPGTPAWAPALDSELWPLIGVAALALAAVWRYFTYAYGIGDDALVIRSGVFARSLRVIPFARIHNVAIEQSVLHRVFNVASVRLESAGSGRPEAEMRVLSLQAAVALEALVRRHTAEPAASPSPTQDASVDGLRESDTPAAVVAPRTPTTSEPAVLLTLPVRELILQGLLSNRGLIAVGAIFAAISQPGAGFDWKFAWRFVERWGRAALGLGPETFIRQGPLAVVTYGAALLVMALLAVRGLSIALTLLQDYGFTLSRQGRRLTVERGLLSRVRTSISRRRIQAWTLSEPLLHRLVGRRSLAIDNAAGAGEGEVQHTLRTLAPIIRPDAADTLIHAIAPDAGWTEVVWKGLSRGHWWRRCLPGTLVTLAVSSIATWRLGPGGLLILLCLPLLALRASREADLTRWAVTTSLVAIQEGWLKRTWRFAELDKLQVVELSRSPLDHRLGTATLWIDTAGAGALSPPLRIAYLPQAEAERLADTLSAHLARHALRW